MQFQILKNKVAGSQQSHERMLIKFCEILPCPGTDPINAASAHLFGALIYVLTRFFDCDRLLAPVQKRSQL
ncbi:MAG: hypothetical protein C5B53_11620 [Candidatus Melainabacteria bacterium]|nr:MAG: hypothetical protein C5B53_11620 [Candidatus Melainabacteria bacterium]